MQRILVPTLAAVLLAPLGTLTGADVEWADGANRSTATSTVQPVGFVSRMFARSGGCACQAPSCEAPPCEAPGCTTPACGCDTGCHNPCDRGLLGKLRCRLQTAAARRCYRAGYPSCAGCTTPTCGAISSLAAIRVRGYLGGYRCATTTSCEPPPCCPDPVCRNAWGNYCFERRPSLIDAMRISAARIRARRCCNRGCASFGCAAPGCATGCCTAPADALQSPFEDDPQQAPPAPPVETSQRPQHPQHLRPLGAAGKTAMGTGVVAPRAPAYLNARLRSAAPRRLISRTAHEEELGAADAVASPRRLHGKQLEATKLDAPAETLSELSALPSLIQFIK